MRNGSGAPVSTEDATIGNITREKNRHVYQIIEKVEALFSVIGDRSA